MWSQLILVSCCLLLAGVSGDEREDYLEKFTPCDLSGGYDGRCVKTSLCEPKKKPWDPSMGYRDGTDIENEKYQRGPCEFLEVCCPEDKVKMVKPEAQVAVGCGYSNPGATSFRALGGDYATAEYSEFPWMVALMKRNVDTGKFHDSYFGGGVLIDPSVVLTVAHKVNELAPSDLKIRAGEWDTTNDNETYPHQDRNVKDILVHEDFVYLTAHNDIALVVLERPFLLQGMPNIGIACLEPKLPPPGKKCVSMGWGKDFINGESYARKLKRITLPLVAHGECEDAYKNTILGPTYSLHSSHTCAGGVADVDTCIGDGGSSLVCEIYDLQHIRYSVVGLVSFGLECGAANQPGVYASVPQLYGWIQEKMASYGFRNEDYIYAI